MLLHNHMELKRFDDWNEKKKRIDAEGKRPPYFTVGEIWWAKLGKNIATEVAGKGDDFDRPVFILKIVYGNSCVVIPLTSKPRKGDYYYTFQDSKGKEQCALLAQMKYIDGKRLKYRFAKASHQTTKDILANLMKFLEI